MFGISLGDIVVGFGVAKISDEVSAAFFLKGVGLGDLLALGT